MFINNKYKRWYDSIIDNAQGREIAEYTENHHIIPKSLGGSNELENLVALTAKEHFICHLLLSKMVESKKAKWQMMNALGCMMWRETKDQKRYKVNSRLYEHLKKKHNKLLSWAQTGERNGMYGRKHTKESKSKMSENSKGKTAWNKGTKGVCKGNPGLVHTEQAKQKIRDARAKQVIKHSDETKEKMRQAALKRWAKQKELTP